MNKTKSPLKHTKDGVGLNEDHSLLSEKDHDKVHELVKVHDRSEKGLFGDDDEVEEVKKEVKKEVKREVKENPLGLRVPTAEEMADYEIEVEERVDKAMVGYENSGNYTQDIDGYNEELVKIRKQKTKQVMSTPANEELSKTTQEFYQDEEEYQKPFVKPKLSQDKNGNWTVNGVIPDNSEDRLESAMMPYVKSNEYNANELKKIRERLSKAINDGENLDEVSPMKPMGTFSSAYNFFNKEEPTVTDVSSLVPDANEISEMTEGSMSFIEENFVENYNKKI